MATSPQSKQIVQLDPYVDSSANIRSHAIPTQRGNQNFYVLVSQIFGGLLKSDVGLGNVDDTSDELKPLGLATRTALEGKAASTHGHAISSVTGLPAILTGLVSKDDQAFFQAKITELLPTTLVKEVSSEW